MAFQNGHQKVEGRKKGVSNKLTSEVRSLPKCVVHNELLNIEDLLDRLEPKERAQELIKLLPFILPKIDSINMRDGEPYEWPVLDDDWRD